MSRYRDRRVTMKIKFNTKDQLLDALEGIRPVAEQKDADAIKKHMADEKAYAAAWKVACREAAKFDYATIKEAGFRIPLPSDLSKPDCPVPWTEKLAKALHFLSITQQQSFTFDDSNYYGTERDIYALLMLGSPEVKAVC